MKSLLLAIVVVIAAILNAAAVKTGEAAPGFNLKSMDGSMISLASLKGKTVVLHVAATWCPFCNAEAPHLESLWQKYKDKGVQVLIIDVKEKPRMVKKWIKRLKPTFSVLLDPDGKVAASYAPPEAQPALPRDEVMIASNLVIDKKGVVQFFSLLDTASFDAQLTALTKRLEEVLALP